MSIVANFLPAIKSVAGGFLTDTCLIQTRLDGVDEYGSPRDTDWTTSFENIPCRLISDRGTRQSGEGASWNADTNTRVERYVLALPAGQSIPKPARIVIGERTWDVDEALAGLTDGVFNRVSLVAVS